MERFSSKRLKEILETQVVEKILTLRQKHCTIIVFVQVNRKKVYVINMVVQLWANSFCTLLTKSSCENLC